MSWLNFFNKPTEVKHPFGRGINADINPDEEELFNNSLEAFEKKDIINAYEYLFSSMENFGNSISNQNIRLTNETDKLSFEIFQGTAKIEGYVTDSHLYAEVTLIKKEFANVALKRYILERNYQLTYAYYFSDDEFIKLKLYQDNITMSPQKIFYPLRELALNADFDKEYTKTEFPDIVLEDIAHIEPLDEDELKIKYKYMQDSIDETLAKIATFPSNDNVGMLSFAFLYLLFKIDYLLVPKYNIYQKMSKKVQEYFSDENTTLETKNEELRKYINQLKEMSFTEFSKNFYNAKYTFTPSDKTPQDEINSFISDSLVKIRWYKNNRYTQIIPTIYKYIAFNIMYNYGLIPVVKELVHTLIEIQNQSFFNKLGYVELYDEEMNKFAKKRIVSKIENIINPYKKRYKLLESFGHKLNYSTLNEFSNSFYLNLQNLNFEEV